MYKKFSLIIALILVNFNLLATADEPINIIYLIPENSCEYVTQGKIHCLKGNLMAYRHHGNGCEISYLNKYTNFSCTFCPPKGQLLLPGIYENAERFSREGISPKLDIGGFGRGYNNLKGSFEIFEITYDEEGKISSFAADFKVDDKIKGAVRFNSNYPIDDFFIRMTDPNINWKSQQLFYVKKFTQTMPHEDLVVMDRTNLSIALEENNGLGLVIEDDRCSSFKNRITFHIPNLSDLIGSKNYNIQPAVKRDRYNDNWSGGEFDDVEKSTGITIETKEGERINAFNGNFTISDLIFDIKNNKFISIAIDFYFNDNAGNSYIGVIRYNSNILVSLEELS